MMMYSKPDSFSTQKTKYGMCSIFCQLLRHENMFEFIEKN